MKNHDWIGLGALDWTGLDRAGYWAWASWAGLAGWVGLGHWTGLSQPKDSAHGLDWTLYGAVVGMVHAAPRSVLVGILVFGISLQVRSTCNIVDYLTHILSRLLHLHSGPLAGDPYMGRPRDHGD